MSHMVYRTAPFSMILKDSKPRFQGLAILWHWITGSALALHCVKAHRQSQWRSPNFTPPPVKFTPLKFSRSNSAHVTTSRTSTPVPNFIAISLRVAFPQICEILRFCDFFVVLSCPVLIILFFLATPPKSNPCTDFNHSWLKWRVVTQGCAFWGFGWWPTIFRGSNPPKPPKRGRG